MRVFEKNELKLLWPFYLESLIFPLLFFASAFYVVYFVESGLSLFRVGLILAAPSLTALLFEIPTGAVADIYGRKTSVLIGYLLQGTGYFMLFFSRNFYFMFACFAFIGFASTFTSGAMEAWVTDLIKSKNKKLLHNYFSNIQIFDNIGLIVSGIIGALLVKSAGMSLIWIFAGAAFMVSCFVLAFSTEVFKKRSGIAHPYRQFKRQIKNSVSYSYRHPVLFFVLLATLILIFGAYFDYDVSWVPLLQSLGMPDYAFGYLYSATSFVIILSSLFSRKFLKRGKERNFIVTFIVFSAITSFLAIIVYNRIFGVILFLFSYFFFFGMKPASRVYFHRFVPSKMRATIGGFESMIWGVASVLALPISGLLVDIIGPRYTIAVAGVMALLAAFVYLRIKEEKISS